MLSISAMAGGQGHYYTGLAREDYYLEGGEPPGLWTGDGAKLLGCRGEVDKGIFAKLFDGFDARGQPLVQNAGDLTRQAGWDLTFSVPKSVSVLWSLLPTEQGAAIRSAHDEAVKAACAYLEDQAGWTRRGKAGNFREKAGLVIGLFEHGTSRAGDPQLHTHALVLNLGVREDGSTGTILSKDFYQHKMAAGALYRAELASQLQERLALGVERVGTWFEVKGVNSKLIEHWSTRRKEIEAALVESGYSSSKAAEMAALSTRHAKEHIARETLFSEWRGKGQEMGWGTAEALALCQAVKALTPDEIAVAKALALKDAVSQLTAQQSYFSEKDLIRRVAEHSIERGLGCKDVLGAAREFLASTAISLGTRGGVALFSTPEMLEIEKRLLERVDASKVHTTHLVSARALKEGLEAHPHLNLQQREAVVHLTAETGGVAVVSGMAGTGKTTMLQAAAEIWKNHGLEVKGAALAGKAADGLSTEAGIPSATIAKLLYLAEESHKPGSRVRNPFTDDTILVVDEAGMVGTRQMEQLLDEAARAGAKVALVGDARQLQPIEAGGPFASIASRLGQAVLTTIVRQIDAWSRDAIHDMADGNAARALEAFALRGLVSVSDGKSAARGALLAAWKGDGIGRPEENLILAGTNKDAAILNREAQALRSKEGELGLLFLRAGGDSFHKGDRLLFTKNSGPMGVKNGQLGVVTHVDCVAGTLSVKLDNDRKVTVPLKEYSNIKLGYAVTTHKSQGMTTQNAFVLTDDSMQDKELSYVQASRARAETRIFTTRAEAGQELSALARAMSNSHQKQLASDILGDAEAVAAALKKQREQQVVLEERPELDKTRS